MPGNMFGVIAIMSRHICLIKNAAELGIRKVDFLLASTAFPWENSPTQAFHGSTWLYVMQPPLYSLGSRDSPIALIYKYEFNLMNRGIRAFRALFSAVGVTSPHASACRKSFIWSAVKAK